MAELEKLISEAMQIVTTGKKTYKLLRCLEQYPSESESLLFEACFKLEQICNQIADQQVLIGQLAEALQGSILAIYEINNQVNPVLILAGTKPFPMPPMEAMKKALNDAGYPVYESKEVALAAAEKLKEE